MQRDRAHLFDIVDSARLAVSYLESISQADFFRDIQLQDSVIRRIEIIGEATRRLGPETRKQFDRLPWHEIVGMRNRLTHEYDDIDLRVVWRTVKRDLPQLIAALEPYIGEDQG